MGDQASEWSVGLVSWILADGNYGPFSVAQIAEFALTFYSKDGLQISPVREKSARLVSECLYEVVAEVLYAANGCWVIDFGVLAFQDQSPPAGISAGSFVRGELSLTIDPFFYFERLWKLPNVPALIYTWRLEELALNTTPWIEVVKNGRVVNVLDETRVSYEKVTSTSDRSLSGLQGDSWVFRCSRLNVPPKHEISKRRWA